MSPAFVFKRFIEGIISLLFLATLLFILLRFVPGGPFDEEIQLAPEVLANLKRQYLLDQSLFTQWVHYMGNLFRGELGVSYYFVDRSVADILLQSFPASFVLGFSTLLLSLVLGATLGILGAWFEGGIADFLIRFTTISGLSLPTFFVAPVLILVFATYSIHVSDIPSLVFKRKYY